MLGVLTALSATAAAQTQPPVRARYMTSSTQANDNSLNPHFDVINSGTSAVSMSELTLRYWFTGDGTEPEAFSCDWTSRGCSNVTSRFVTLNPAAATADTYLELGFLSGAGSLLPGESFGEIQSRVNKTDWTNYTEANDYSYDATKLALADWDHVTLYRNGVLIWGTEPGGAVATPDFALAAAQPALSVPEGGTATTAISITRANGFTTAVSFAASGLPTGVTASFAPSPTTTGTTTLTLTASATAAIATTPFTVTSTGGSITHALSLSVSVTAAAGYTLAVAPTAMTVVAGSTGITTVTVNRTSFTAAVALSASGLPTGVTATFNPASTTGNSSALTLAASATATTGAATITITGISGTLTRTTTLAITVGAVGSVNAYTQRFNDMWNAMHGNNGYFHAASGLPYHSVETLMVEAPDQGHETTSEAVSYWAWLEVMHGNITGDWAPLQKVFDTMEAFMIPTPADQPTNSFYTPNDPADYAPEADLPSGYPSLINPGIPVGSDPIADDLLATYGNRNIYAMHWILDVDNFYGFGRRGDNVSQPSYINTFQRGAQESTWETVPQPSWEDFQWGAKANGGFLNLFITGPTPAQQWRYTDAPDADARLIQAMYWANQFAPTNPTVAALSAKAAKMGDFLRYSFFDKYFKQLGCTSPSCPAGTGYNGAHFLLAWYFAWGGPIPPQSGWSFRIGASATHFGYQNPMAAFALTNTPALMPKSAGGVRDWTTSLGRQLEFYRWLQSAGGGIAGGATNSLGGRYLAPTPGVSTFYGMFFQENPVYLDPGSNTWFGFQVWSMERMAEYYYNTNNAQAKLILDKWVPWAMTNTHLFADGTFEVPSTLGLGGQPSTNWTATNQNWNAADTTFNANLTVQPTTWGTDLGVTAGLAKVLTYYSAGTKRWATQNVAAQTMAKELLDRTWTLFRDPIGVSAPEVRMDYNRFGDAVFIPSGFTGTMPNGDLLNGSTTFLSMRSKYRNDPAFAKVQAYLNGGPAPTFNYHRFWAQTDVALANAEYGRLFP